MNSIEAFKQWAGMGADSRYANIEAEAALAKICAEYCIKKKPQHHVS